MPAKKVTEIKTLFMGTGNFAGIILQALLEAGHPMFVGTSDVHFDIAAIFTKPDKTIHKNSAPGNNEVKEIALKNNITVYQPEKLDADIISQIKIIAPDLILIVAYGKIISKKIIAIPKFGCVNVHPSLLPKFRGPSPIQNALLSGEKETGTTIMLIDEKMDTGAILNQKKYAINSNDTYRELSEKLAVLSSGLLLETLPLWIEGKIKPTPQNNAEASLCQLIEREDGHIIWDEEAENIYNRYRALSPWPGIFTFWKNGENLARLKLQKISLLSDNNREMHRAIGEIFKTEEGIAVQTLKGAIILKEVQLEGKKKTDIKSFINGYPKFIGTILQ